MAALDGALKSIMQGVSQQVPRERLDGQVSLQVNMLSDPVMGMRRRPGMHLLTQGLFPTGTWTREQLFATSVDIEDTNVHVLINTGTGTVQVRNESMGLLYESTQPYFQAASAAHIQTATLRGYLYICNTSIKPVKVADQTGRLDPKTTAFFYIRATQFSKLFTVSINSGGVAYSVNHTTSASTAAQATPEYVATQLVTAINALAIPNLTVIRLGGYVFLKSTDTVNTLSVTSDSGSTYIAVSNNSQVNNVSDLPARMPTEANGMLVAVGSSIKKAVWYQFEFATNSWLEAGDYTSASSLTGMPWRMKLDDTYLLQQPVYEGRLAGNDETNEDPPFLTEGVTGLSSFQGRLVLLSGPSICMSAAGKPLRWYRSTVTDLLVVDPIAIYSGAATSTNFTHAVQFNKDLLLFSKSCQAVVPSGNAVIAPSTAQIVITSSYSCTDRCAPIVAGRSLLYFTPRSEAYAGVLELVPSNTTDSQYTSTDVTAHLPRYMPGQIRQATASSTSNSLVLVADGDSRTLFVQDYLWSGEGKIQSAWHTWTTPYDIVATWFVRDTVYVGLLIDGKLSVATIEPQAGATVEGNYRPFSDLYTVVNVVNGVFTVPVHLRTAMTAGVKPMLTYAGGDLAGEWVGVASSETVTWTATVVRNVPDGVYLCGLRYRSALSPTPPLLRDEKEVVIGTSRAILIRYELSMYNAGTFNALVQRNDVELSTGAYSGLLYSSSDLMPNTPLFGVNSKVIIPVRAISSDTITTLYTDDDHDMGILTIEYVMQYHARRRRA